MNTAVAPHPHTSSAHAISAFLSRYYWHIVSAVAAVLTIMAMIVDFRRKMWIDELYTLLIANQKSIREIIKATAEGCDAAPPLYAILVHALLPLIPSEEFAVRLLATVGYGAMVLLIAAFFRCIFSASFALAAVFLTCLCTFEWAYEGRGYGLVLGFSGCALYCWRIMAETNRAPWSRALFVFSAGMMTALHFYALFFFVPLFMADIYRRYRDGRMNWKVWAATVTVIAAVLCVHYPVLVGNQRFLPFNWSPALWKFFPGSIPLNITAKYVYELAVVLFAIAVLRYRSRFMEAARGLLDEYLWTAFLLYFVLPAAIFALSVYTTHGFISRYTIWLFIGAGGLAISLFALATKLNELAAAVLAGILLVAVMVAPIQKIVEKSHLLVSEVALQEVMGLPHDSTAIVIADHHVFMELYHYAPLPIRNRLVYPLSRDFDIRYLGYDTGALLMDAIRKRYHFPVVPYKEIVDRYDHFYVVSSLDHYLPSMLRKDGRSVRKMQAEGCFALYQVRAGKMN